MKLESRRIAVSTTAGNVDLDEREREKNSRCTITHRVFREVRLSRENRKRWRRVHGRPVVATFSVFESREKKNKRHRRERDRKRNTRVGNNCCSDKWTYTSRRRRVNVPLRNHVDPRRQCQSFIIGLRMNDRPPHLPPITVSLPKAQYRVIVVSAARLRFRLFYTYICIHPRDIMPRIITVI